jgi:hypothetical protein
MRDKNRQTKEETREVELGHKAYSTFFWSGIPSPSESARTTVDVMVCSNVFHAVRVKVSTDLNVTVVAEGLGC